MASRYIPPSRINGYYKNKPDFIMRNIVILFIALILLSSPFKAHSEGDNPLENLNNHTLSFFSQCFLEGEVPIYQCLNETLEDCFIYVEGYSRNDRPCVNSSRISSISYIINYIENNNLGFSVTEIEHIEASSGNFCADVFSVKPQENTGATLDHCIYSATELMLQYLEDEIREPL